jgi:hypothetical protein
MSNQSKFEKTYTYALELVTTNDSVKAILDDRVQSKDEGEMVEYIGSSISNIEFKIAKAKEKVKYIQDAIKDEELRLISVKEQVAEWLEDSGVEKMQGGLGDDVSSITIYKAKPQENLIVTDEEALINGGYFKTVVDKAKAKEALIAGVEVEGAHIEVVHVANKIKVNKKR